MESGNLGLDVARWSARNEAPPLPGDGARRLGEPGRDSLRLADPDPRRLRRLRARHNGDARLDDRGDAPLHGPARAPAAEHDAGARSRPARGRGRARRALLGRPAQTGPPARADGAPPGRARLPDNLLGRSARPRRRPAPRRRARAHRLLSHLPRHTERDLLRRSEDGAFSRNEPRRQRRPPLPRGLDRRHEGDARSRRVDDDVPRLAPRGLDRFLRLERPEQPAGYDEVPLPREGERGEDRRRQPLPRAGARAVLGALGARERPLRNPTRRRLVRRRHGRGSRRPGAG